MAELLSAVIDNPRPIPDNQEMSWDNAIFTLACGCDQVGYSESHAAQQFQAGKGAILYCCTTVQHGYSAVTGFLLLPDLELSGLEEE